MHTLSMPVREIRPCIIELYYKGALRHGSWVCDFAYMRNEWRSGTICSDQKRQLPYNNGRVFVVNKTPLPYILVNLNGFAFRVFIERFGTT